MVTSWTTNNSFSNYNSKSNYTTSAGSPCSVMPMINTLAMVRLVNHENRGTNPYRASLKEEAVLRNGGCLLLGFFLGFEGIGQQN